MTEYTSETRDAKALELLPELRKELGNLADGASDENLLRFLRWKPDIKRASERYRKHIEWRQESPGLFDDQLRLSKDPELKRILESNVIIAPDELKTKSGGSLLVGRFRNNDMTDGRTPKDVARMLLYTMDRVLERKDAQLNGITIFHDLKGLDPRRNFNIEIPRLFISAIIGNFPLRINGIYVYNAPFFFPAFFAVMSRMFLPTKIRERFHRIDNLSELTEGGIDLDDLLVEHGGKLDFITSDWTAKHMQREKDGTMQTMTDIKLPSN